MGTKISELVTIAEVPSPLTLKLSEGGGISKKIVPVSSLRKLDKGAKKKFRSYKLERGKNIASGKSRGQSDIRWII